MTDEIEHLKARKKKLDDDIEAYPYWGAALAAMDEERRAIIRRLESEEKQHD